VSTPQRRVRVLVVGPAPAAAGSRGGMATVAALIAAHPDERFQIVVVPTYVDRSRLVRLGVGIRGMVYASWLLLRGEADVLHVHLAHGGSVLRKAVPLLAARWAHVPAVVHGHSYDFGGWFDRLSSPVQVWVRRALAADHLMVLGERHVDEYMSRIGLTADRITVLHNAVRIPDNPVRQSGVERVHAVALGRLGVRKGSYDVVTALAALDDSARGRLRVTLAGDGEVNGVRAAVTAAGLDGTIDVAGWIDPVARDELLSAAHIFLLPSHDEGLPMALLEAMAYGLAPVTTRVGSIGEAVADGVNGIIVQPGSPGEITDALKALLADEDLRARLGAAARNRATDFGLERWYERLARLWTDLASARQSAR
jgi:glycosyltransferase involved in cell wall biosynthesis